MSVELGCHQICPQRRYLGGVGAAIICKFPQYDDEFFANTEEVEADEEGEEDLTGSLPERGRTEYLL